MTLEETTTGFGLIRHAQTRWNREKRIQGQSDSPLTSDGEHQAVHWGRLLEPFGWDRILTSDTGRAQATAEHINTILKISLTTDRRLREQNWGQWVGKTIADLKADHASELNAQEDAGWAFCPPGGEDRLRVWQRSHKALLEASARWPGTNILVVTHEGVIKSLIYRLCGRKFMAGEPAIIKKHHLHHLVYADIDLRVEELNVLAMD